jgi:hypothetical protein
MVSYFNVHQAKKQNMLKTRYHMVVRNIVQTNKVTNFFGVDSLPYGTLLLCIVITLATWTHMLHGMPRILRCYNVSEVYVVLSLCV